MMIFRILVVFGLLTLLAKVAYTQYTATIFAGSGTQGWSGDNGPATSANVNFATSAWVDTNGATFFVDFSANVVRKVDTSGIITTIGGTGTQSISYSGGAFTSVSLYSPWGVAGDATYLYVSDNYYVWKYTRSSGIVSILAGTGTQGTSGNGGPAASADVNQPTSLWLTTGNILYIAEYGSNLIRKITLSNNIISTVAGSGTAGFGGDGGSPTSTNTMLSSPQGVYVDTNGVIFIAERGNARIRYIANGIINTYAGGGTNSGGGFAATSSRLSTPFAVIGDTIGNIFIVETSDKIKVVDYQTKIVSIYLSGLNFPRGIWFDRINSRAVIPMSTYVKTAPLYSNPVSSVPTASPTLTPSQTPSLIPTRVPTGPLSAMPSCSPSVVPSMIPTVSPTAVPTRSPSTIPTITPSTSPSMTPTTSPSTIPTITPSISPSATPTTSPSTIPTITPSIFPSATPTTSPSTFPTEVPSISPTATPTTSAPSTPPTTPTPSTSPTFSPSATPSYSPTTIPTTSPTMIPTASPSAGPSQTPTMTPSFVPSAIPTPSPTAHPTAAPSSLPTAESEEIVQVQGVARVRFVNGVKLNALSLSTLLTVFQNISEDAELTEISSTVVVAQSLVATTPHRQNVRGGGRAGSGTGTGRGRSVSLTSNQAFYTYDIGFLSTYLKSHHQGYTSSQLASVKAATIRQGIEGGEFESTLRSLARARNATQLLNGSCSEVTSLSSTITTSSSSSSSDKEKLSVAMIIIIVVCVVVGLLCLCGGLLFYKKKSVSEGGGKLKMREVRKVYVEKSSGN